MTTKIICVNKRITSKAIGYSSWAFITFLLAWGMFGMLSEYQLTQADLELQTVQAIDWRCNGISNGTCAENIRDGGFHMNDNPCVQSFFHEKGMTCADEGDYNIKIGLVTVAHLINGVIMFLFFYEKQSKVKFSWCEKKKLEGTKGEDEEE